MTSQHKTPDAHPQGLARQQTSQDHNLQSFHYSQASESYHSSKMKTYNMFYTTSRLNVTLHLGSSSDPCVYYVESTVMTIKKPQLQLRHGNSPSSPMVAFARLPLTSRHMLLGSGDYEKNLEEQLVWEELHRQHNAFQKSDYEFGTAIASVSGRRKMYRWIRDRTKTVSNVFHCVSENEELVASMLSGGMLNWNKGGEIEVAEGLEKGLEELLIMSAVAIWVFEAPSAFSKGYENE